MKKYILTLGSLLLASVGFVGAVQASTLTSSSDTYATTGAFGGFSVGGKYNVSEQDFGVTAAVKLADLGGIQLYAAGDVVFNVVPKELKKGYKYTPDGGAKKTLEKDAGSATAYEGDLVGKAFVTPSLFLYGKAGYRQYNFTYKDAYTYATLDGKTGEYVHKKNGTASQGAFDGAVGVGLKLGSGVSAVIAYEKFFRKDKDLYTQNLKSDVELNVSKRF